LKIVRYYSHQNGLEFLEARKPRLWSEIQEVVAAADAARCRTKISKEKTKSGKLLYSPHKLNKEMQDGFAERKWKQRRTDYYVTGDAKLIRKTLQMSPDKQRKEIIAAGEEATHSFNQTDFVKDRVAVEVQFGKYFAVAYDLFVKHLAFYIGDVIDVGVEIVPMKSLNAQMSTGVAWYERELYNLIREGRGVPAVPLVLIGVAP
jgi:hypothetical protein